MAGISYGEVFRKLRESRNISLKQAAEGIVSYQTLRRFELGETDVTLEVLMKLLQRIVVEFLDFIHKYEREGGVVPGANPVLDEKIREYELRADISGAISYCKQYLKNENLSFYDRLVIMTYVNTKVIYLPSPVPAILQENERIVLDYLQSVDDYYSVDYALIISLLQSKSGNQFFSQEFVQICLDKILEKDRLTGEIDLIMELVERHLLLAGIAWLSRKGEYELAESYCLHAIEGLRLNRRKSVENEIIASYEVLAQIKLRQNKVEGVELANKIVAFYDARIALTHEIYKIDQRRDFVDYVYQLNKTGVDFDF